jgi:hypothetical protein
MQPHREHSDDPPSSPNTRRLVLGVFVAVVIAILVLLHVLGVIHG